MTFVLELWLKLVEHQLALPKCCLNMFEGECIGQFHHEMERELCWANLTLQDMSNFDMYGLQNQLGIQIQVAACTLLLNPGQHVAESNLGTTKK